MEPGLPQHGDAVDVLNPARLEFSRRLAGFSSAIELATVMGVHKTTVWNWQNGRSSPHRSTLEVLANELGVPTSFLTDPVPLPELRGAFFRAPSRSRRAMFGRFESYASLVGLMGLHLFGSRAVHHEVVQPAAMPPSAMASRVRTMLSLGETPIPSVVGLAEHLGVMVVYAPRGDQITDAFSARVGTVPVIVLSPDKGDYYRQRFDVAHELGHLLLHSMNESKSRREVEAEADAFASALLFPRSASSMGLLRRAVMDSSLNSLSAMQDTWGYSVDGLLDVANRGLSGPARTAASAKRSERNRQRTRPVGLARTPESLDRVADAAEEYLINVSPQAGIGYLSLESDISELYVRAMLARAPGDAPQWRT